MPILNYAVDPPMIEIGEPMLSREFSLLAPKNETGEGEDRECSYPISDLVAFTRNLMHVLDCNFDPLNDLWDGRKLEDFTEEERRLYYPFAFMMACVDGNCFRTGHLNGILENGDKIAPSPETISYYIPVAYRLIAANGGDLNEVRQIIKEAAGRSE